MTTKNEAQRSRYLRAIEAFAQQIKPRLMTGEMSASAVAFDADNAPFDRLMEAAAQRFGLEVTETTGLAGSAQLKGDSRAARRVLAASPSADRLGDGWNHPCYWAAMAVTEDVLLVAQVRGWDVRPE